MAKLVKEFKVVNEMKKKAKDRLSDNLINIQKLTNEKNVDGKDINDWYIEILKYDSMMIKLDYFNVSFSRIINWYKNLKLKNIEISLERLETLRRARLTFENDEDDNFEGILVLSKVIVDGAMDSISGTITCIKENK